DYAQHHRQVQQHCPGGCGMSGGRAGSWQTIVAKVPSLPYTQRRGQHSTALGLGDMSSRAEVKVASRQNAGSEGSNGMKSLSDQGFGGNSSVVSESPGTSPP